MKPRLKVALLLVSLITLGRAQDVAAQGDVLELTPAVLDRFIASAAHEVLERERLYATEPQIKAMQDLDTCRMNAQDEAAARRCQPEPKDQTAELFAKWETCAAEAVPEAKKFAADYQAAAAKGDKATMSKLLEGAQALQNKAVAKCGAMPERSRQRSSSRPPQPTEEELARGAQVIEQMRLFDEQAFAAAWQAGKFTERQYVIVRERVIAFLKLLEGPDGNLDGYKFKPSETATLRSYQSRLAVAAKHSM